MNIDDVIRLYIKLRGKKIEIETKAKEEIAAIKEKMDKIEAYLKAQMDEQGVMSFKSEHGTAFLVTKDYAEVADWNEVIKFVRENDYFDMLEKRVSKLAVRDYVERYQKVPPGINYGTKMEVNIRKPGAKVT